MYLLHRPTFLELACMVQRQPRCSSIVYEAVVEPVCTVFKLYRYVWTCRRALL